MTNENVAVENSRRTLKPVLLDRQMNASPAEGDAIVPCHLPYRPGAVWHISRGGAKQASPHYIERLIDISSV
jgi:hypothetical protein